MKKILFIFALLFYYLSSFSQTIHVENLPTYSGNTDNNYLLLTTPGGTSYKIAGGNYGIGDVYARNDSFFKKRFGQEVFFYKVLTSSSGVSSFNARTGAVTPQTNDYTFAQIGSKPTTLAGYGLNGDAYSKTELQTSGAANVHFLNIHNWSGANTDFIRGGDGNAQNFFTTSRSTPLTGIDDLVVFARINENDNLMAGLGHLQGQIDDLTSHSQGSVSQLITSGTDINITGVGTPLNPLVINSTVRPLPYMTPGYGMNGTGFNGTGAVNDWSPDSAKWATVNMINNLGSGGTGDSSAVFPQFYADSVVNMPFTGISNTYYLITHTTPTKLLDGITNNPFHGFEDNIVQVISPGNYHFNPPVNNEQIVVFNDNTRAVYYQYVVNIWKFSPRFVPNGGIKDGVPLDLLTIDNYQTRLGTHNKFWLVVKTNGDVALNKWKGYTNHKWYYYPDSATGNFALDSFQNWIPGSGISIVGNVISATGVGGTGGISKLGISPYGLTKVNDSTYKVDSSLLQTKLGLNTVNISTFPNNLGYLTSISGIAAGGDLSGTYPNPTVSGVKGLVIPTLVTGNLRYNGTSWVFDNTVYLTPANYIVRETPSGTINGSNTVFVLANTPIVGKEMVFENGQLQESGGGDYNISGATITFVTAPPTGAKIVATYFK